MKRANDFQKAVSKRETTANYLNTFVEPYGFKFWRLNTILDKKKLGKTLFLGLDYVFGKNVIPTHESKVIRIAFLYKDSGSLYRKLPTLYINKPDEYLKMLISFNYYIIVVDYENKQYSGPISVEYAVKHWKYAMATSKGNYNRLNFYVPISTFTFAEPNDGSSDIINGSLVQRLIKLI